MKTENDVQSLDELVFEHRNKLYGAYAIRKSYADRLNRAMLLVFGSALALFLLTKILPSTAPIVIPTIPDGIVDLVDVPTIDVEVSEPVKQPAIRKATPNLAFVATTSPDPQVETPATEAVSGAVDGVEGGEAPPEGAVEGTGTEAIATPAIPEIPMIVDHAEFMPQYEGGLSAMVKFISSKLRYPPIARRTEVEGTVYVSFVINTDGRVIDAKVVKGISKECDAEAIRVVSMMPRWSAGRQGNVPVMVRMVLPIKFQLAH